MVYTGALTSTKQHMIEGFAINQRLSPSVNSVIWSIQGEVGQIINALDGIFREHSFSLDMQSFSGSHILLQWDGVAGLFRRSPQH